MLERGQKVVVRQSSKRWKFFKNCIFIVENVSNDICLVMGIKGMKLGENCSSVRGMWNSFMPQELKPFAPTCPVCNQEIQLEDNKVKEHNHNYAVCYGSYTPYV